MTQEETIRILNKFENDLDNIITEHLVGRVTKEQVNEYYGWGNDCQIAEKLEEAEELDKLLREKR